MSPGKISEQLNR